MKRKGFLIKQALIVSVIAGLFLAACSSQGDEQSSESGFSPVGITSPRLSKMTDFLNLTASTIFLKKEAVRAPFAGYIQKVLKNVGDGVNAGDVVLLLQTREENALGSGDNSLVQIKAKSTGILTQLNYHTGDYVAEGEQIAGIANPSSLTIQLNVPYQNLKEVRVGSACTIILPDGRTLAGKIDKSMPIVDASAQTQTFLVNCGSIASLPENLNLAVQIPVKYAPDAVAVPKNCVLSNETMDEFWIMKLINDSTAVKEKITKGIENDSLVQIVSPKLTPSDKIIIEGGYGLADTAKVIVKR